ncbi:Rha family transcriptional regulator [Pseudomonas juntendi]|uniref:Rha family transcriptional regulator n=1 Tax=Pseudomonas juntendi TaxID=2666183 RepID=UPI00244911C5|nr:Rha family transcriptional regulator [Pseudomonas juntendi]MDH0042408.1 Rha family transcriptional regulator [Pseudomonas juntendi]
MKAIAPVAPVAVELIDGHPTTTSLDVAAHFGKLHKDVLKRIANLDCSPEFTQRNFAPCTRPGSNNKPEPYYRMTRDGFTFLCMGFTGKEAAKWKEAYINAFNQLEQAVTEKSNLPAVQEAVFEQRAFRGRHILIAELDGKPWFSAGNLCTALNLGSSDRIVRSLVPQHKRKLQRGSRDLWMVDATGAQRAADYCNTELAAEYRDWLQRLLAERAGCEAPRVAPGAWPGEQDALRDLPAQTEQLLSQQLLRSRFLMYFDLTGEMHIKAIEPDTALLNRERLAMFIGDPEGAPRSTLPDILEAVSRRMKSPH